MITKELFDKVHLINIKSKKKISNLFSGNYSSAFRGRGLEFDHVREYCHGDDVRSIDWNVTAKQQVPFIKTYVEERELTLIFAVDLSSSLFFGGDSDLKEERAAEIVALLSLAASLNRDKVSLITFTDRVIDYIPPGRGESTRLQIVEKVLEQPNIQQGTSIASSFEWINSLRLKRSVLFLISDFEEDLSRWSKPFKIISQKHDLTAIRIQAPVESKLENMGMLSVYDSETGHFLSVPSGFSLFRNRYNLFRQEQSAELATFFRQNRADYISLLTTEDWVHSLVLFFQKRDLRGVRV